MANRIKGITVEIGGDTTKLQNALKGVNSSIKTTQAELKDVEKQRIRPTDREMTTPLFLLRCVQLGISIRDLDLLTIGMVNDMYVESGNDQDADKNYSVLATQADFDRF